MISIYIIYELFIEKYIYLYYMFVFYHAVYIVHRPWLGD